MSPPINIDSSQVSGITIDGTSVSEVTVDGSTVFSAIPVSDIAQFEEGVLHPSFTGGTGDWVVDSTSPTLTGQFSLKHSTQSPQLIYSTSGLENYPQQDQRVSCYVRFESDNTASELSYYIFAFQDTDNYYAVGCVPKNDEIRFIHVDGGTRNPVTASASQSFDVWYDYETEWLSNGDITVRVFEVDSNGDRQGSALGTLTTSNTALTTSDQGIGFGQFASGASPFYDNYRILEDLS